jgi:hypothetical protein
MDWSKFLLRWAGKQLGGWDTSITKKERCKDKNDQEGWMARTKDCSIGLTSGEFLHRYQFFRPVCKQLGASNLANSGKAATIYLATRHQ